MYRALLNKRHNSTTSTIQIRKDVEVWGKPLEEAYNEGIGSLNFLKAKNGALVSQGKDFLELALAELNITLT